MTDTLTLADFLLARIAEDEAAAKAATQGRWGVESHPTREPIPMGVVALRDGAYAGVVAQVGDSEENGPNLAHIARHDPARVLADCAAHRAIVERHLWSCDDIRALAAIYSDHPDYREEWRA